MDVNDELLEGIKRLWKCSTWKTSEGKKIKVKKTNGYPRKIHDVKQKLNMLGPDKQLVAGTQLNK